MNIAVFGDLHGNILRAFKMGLHWQQQTGKQLDLMLQVGDLGVFPDLARLDRATRRHSELSSAVLGFQNHFTSYHPEVAAILNETVCPLLFVRGNHEDHIWLDAHEQRSLGPLFPVDVYTRLWCLKTGIPYTLQRRDERITILGIGRIGWPAAAKKAKRHYIQPYEYDQLNQLGATSIDILLTHDAPRDAIYPGVGSFEIEHVLKRQLPHYLFFGHYGGPIRSHLDANGVTHSYKLPDLAWEPHQLEDPLGTGTMGLLWWQDEGKHTFEIVEVPREKATFDP